MTDDGTNPFGTGPTGSVPTGVGDRLGCGAIPNDGRGGNVGDGLCAAGVTWLVDVHETRPTAATACQERAAIRADPSENGAAGASLVCRTACDRNGSLLPRERHSSRSRQAKTPETMKTAVPASARKNPGPRYGLKPSLSARPTLSMYSMYSPSEMKKSRKTKKNRM